MLNVSDLFNGLFELAGGLLVGLSIYRLYKDKKIMGVSIIPVAFFTLWGIWNVYFYPVNGLMFSFIGGIVLCAANLVWVGQMFYYGFGKMVTPAIPTCLCVEEMRKKLVEDHGSIKKASTICSSPYQSFLKRMNGKGEWSLLDATNFENAFDFNVRHYDDNSVYFVKK